MSTVTESGADERAAHFVKTIRHELHSFKKEWWVFLLLGITLLICGIVATTFPFVSSIGVIIVIGATLIVGGVSLVVSSFWSGRWGGFFLQILVGIFYLVAGYTIFDAPLTSLLVFTLLLAAFFIVIGLLRIITSLVERYPMWGWSLFNGIVTLIVGVIIYRHCRPNEIAKGLSEGDLTTLGNSWLWVIGLLVGIDLLFNGLSWIMLSLALRRLPDNESAT
jgi:uncharacterized membrane protein HdeD (DUF308 family)